MTTGETEGESNIFPSLPPSSPGFPGHGDPGKSAESGAAKATLRPPVETTPDRTKQKPRNASLTAISNARVRDAQNCAPQASALSVLQFHCTQSSLAFRESRNAHRCQAV